MLFKKKEKNISTPLTMRQNSPINAQLLGGLFKDKDDLSKTWPQARWPFFAPEWAYWFRSNKSSVSLLFEKGEKIMGHAALQRNRNEKNRLMLCFFILKSEFRGRGFSIEMLKLIDDFVKEHYSDKFLFLNVDINNTVAYKLYQKFGYVLVRKNIHRYLMKKEIQNS